MLLKKVRGSFLIQQMEKNILDFVQGIAVNSLGHSNPYLIKAINEQAKKVWHVSNAFIIPEGERLAKKLTQKTFADYVFFKTLAQKQQKQQLKLQEDIFTQKEKK